MAKVNKRLLRYTEVLKERVYRPIKPLINPLVNKIKLWHVLTMMTGIGLMGSLSNGWQVGPQMRTAWWPWSVKAHSKMALAWFENGNEEKALEELQLANRLVIFKTEKIKAELKKTESIVNEPKEIGEEIKSWEKILKEKPYYKDVLLRLALLSYQIYEDEKAKEYFEQAYYLDPNGEEVQEVKKVIFSLGPL